MARSYPEKNGMGGDRTIMTYLMHQFLDFGSERIFPLGRDGEVEFLLRGGLDVGLEVEEVGGGLEIDFTVVGVHFLRGRGRGMCFFASAEVDRLRMLGLRVGCDDLELLMFNDGVKGGG